MQGLLKVVARPTRTCFIALPAVFVAGLLTDGATPQGAFRISWGQQQAFVAWAGATAAGRDTIEADAELLRALGLTAGDQVYIESWLAQPVVRVHATPASAGDWEVLEENAGMVEVQLLNQARVVWTGLTLPVWITANIIVRVTISESVVLSRLG